MRIVILSTMIEHSMQIWQITLVLIPLRLHKHTLDGFFWPLLLHRIYPALWSVFDGLHGDSIHGVQATARSEPPQMNLNEHIVLLVVRQVWKIAAMLHQTVLGILQQIVELIAHSLIQRSVVWVVRVNDGDGLLSLLEIRRVHGVAGVVQCESRRQLCSIQCVNLLQHKIGSQRHLNRVWIAQALHFNLCGQRLFDVAPQIKLGHIIGRHPRFVVDVELRADKGIGEQQREDSLRVLVAVCQREVAS
mmetsp:Transcript_56863/g.90598  ORF Transcript_56863/g.90598 Transcript_56863/m.90598 type:complete len:247 (-) Transcript_56863:427-1167(-)